ncbi:MAG TPA: triple tyrosine motif-containing protein [Dinghuibacter sp.]|uniref:triple tyrosine motif-containing protein n=1 Tax=Dinghuibacter sp. TaxID=2024697 RepID=UPI002B7F0F36|nr:triple tyrosine motif-containing protein [Dinghuibacter sp.]HTJ13129.1 triple tyrosine motif-containing protein [Dinghuibacter sp.]
MKRLLLAVFLFTLIGQTEGQNTVGLPLVINYNKLDFHGGAQTWDMAQDRRGMMYFANNEGLMSFDGTYWKIYPLPNGTIVRSITLVDDRIYVGGQGELGYFQPDSTGALRYNSLVGLLPAGQRLFADIWEVYILGESVFFRATNGIFELRNNAFLVYPPQTEWQKMCLAGHRLIAQDKRDGLFYYQGNQWIPLNNRKLLGQENMAGITPIKGDSFLVTTLQRGVYLLRNDTLLNTLGGLKSLTTWISGSARLDDQTLVLATTSEGCVLVDMSGRIAQVVSSKEGLQSDHINCLFLDKDKNIWVGLDNGISMVAYSKAIRYIRPNRDYELYGYSTRIFRGKLYIATSDGVYSVPVPSGSGDLGVERGKFDLVPNSRGLSWRLDEVNQHLLLGHDPGIFDIGKDGAELVSQDASWLFLPMSPVLPSRYLLAGTYTGIKLLEYGQDKFTDLGYPAGCNVSFRFLAIDNDSTVWTSNPYQGIYRLQLSRDKRTYNCRLYTDKDGLPSPLNDFVFRIKNRIVFATVKGVYEFNPSRGKFVPSPLFYPLFGTMDIRYLNEDQEGNIWFCSGKKIGVVHETSNAGSQAPVVTWFPELTGQILSGFESIYPYNPQNIFIASEKGIIHLNYAEYIKDTSTIALLLSTVRAYGRPDSTLFDGYDQSETPHLPSHRNAYHFEFSSPGYGYRQTIEYSYKLEGYDADWSLWTAKSEKDYTNLPDGEYTFEVKAHDNLGNTSESVRYTFVIDPPFYKTIWAYILYGILLLSAGYALKKWHEHRLLSQKRKYEAKQRQIVTLHKLEMENVEKELIRLQNKQLENEIFLKKKELADANMHLLEQEDAFARVKNEINKLYQRTDDRDEVRTALQLLNSIEKNNENWDQFAAYFDQISDDFLKKLNARFPSLSRSDLKLCTYLRLNLSTKEIAKIMNISVRGVEMSRYRIRRKFNIGKKQSLSAFLNSMLQDSPQ